MLDFPQLPVNPIHHVRNMIRRETIATIIRYILHGEVGDLLMMATG